MTMYNVQLTTYHFVVVVVIATTRVVSRILQAGQQSGLPLGVVPHNSGGAHVIRASPASCDDYVVTVGHLDTTSLPGMSYQLVSILLLLTVLIFAYFT